MAVLFCTTERPPGAPTPWDLDGPPAGTPGIFELAGWRRKAGVVAAAACHHGGQQAPLRGRRAATVEGDRWRWGPAPPSLRSAHRHGHRGARSQGCRARRRIEHHIDLTDMVLSQNTENQQLASNLQADRRSTSAAVPQRTQPGEDLDELFGSMDLEDLTESSDDEALLDRHGDLCAVIVPTSAAPLS
mmetsp:Transcript_66310/g.130663  ORF Transcript_66310/g.130663 Transcript_66310/m.130663 type:complete len:188 (-) Transcript_66310:158-721(-)|eukprot:CAMPEP_0172807018 /NCGR_PEP_ID=MMETSP1075-20121228/6729_1 /TAXON_ID=2916 /ORGANISM="Ceratium fusus, Strain PA161109" /LENGTH=187 /DNA_ID=CAMNT_0013645927 /DNA_START=57 /DNA_END=620 /DNA_ORIENTATION=-